MINIFAPALFHTIETIAFYLTRSGHRVRIITNLKGDETSEHPWTLRRLAKIGCDVVEIGSPSQASELLVFSLIRHGKIPNELTAWRKAARAVGFLLSGGRYDDHKERLREVVRSWPHYLGAALAIYQHSPVARWRAFPFYVQKPIYFSPYLHPQFFFPAQLCEAFSKIGSTEQRRFRVGFIGNRQPPERIAHLAQCRRAIDQAGITVIGRDREPSDSKVQALWIEYGGWESTGPRGLDPPAYLRALTDMDFCISPPGWGQQWTHRTIEAIVRGSVPIIMDPHLYNLGLRHGDNCIVVNNDDWFGATRHALAMPRSEVTRLRSAVLVLREKRLAPDIVARNFCSQLLG